jgi:hypothetical protein
VSPKTSQTPKSAVQAIDQHGALLVYPINNRKEPLSLWSVAYPRTAMRWEWDDDGDTRVADLWHLRAQLSSSRKVVYAKWYRGRATFFSRAVFARLIAAAGSAAPRSRASVLATLSYEARAILELLEQDSPLSTKQIKLATDLRGKSLSSVYDRALKLLWQRFLIVGFGEVDDGAFPSLAIGATQTLFEDLWAEAGELAPDEALGELEGMLSAPFFKQLQKTLP